MELEVICQSKSVQSPGVGNTSVILTFTATSGMGNSTFFVSPEKAEEYKLGQKYTITVK